ncbi:MAG: DUF1292 domain-containing protein [Bacilli bacterium]
MNEKEILKVTDENGVEKEIEVVSYFTLNSNGKDYLIYTDANSVEDRDGNILTYTSEVVNNGDSIELKDITDENVLNEIKEIITEIVNEGE